MPIFMDRHDMRGATAENIAEAHRKDLEIQDKYGVKYMTYWYDPENKARFVALGERSSGILRTNTSPDRSKTATSITIRDVRMTRELLREPKR